MVDVCGDGRVHAGGGGADADGQLPDVRDEAADAFVQREYVHVGGVDGCERVHVV